MLQLLKQTWFFFKNHAANICWIILPFVIPVELVNIVTEASAGAEGASPVSMGLAMLVSAVLYPIYQGALVVYMAAVVRDEPLSTKQCYQQALTLWWPLMLLYSLASLAITAGALLFILPGLIVWARLAYTEFYCILQQQSPTESVCQ